MNLVEVNIVVFFTSQPRHGSAICLQEIFADLSHFFLQNVNISEIIVNFAVDKPNIRLFITLLCNSILT